MPHTPHAGDEPGGEKPAGLVQDLGVEEPAELTVEQVLAGVLSTWTPRQVDEALDKLYDRYYRARRQYELARRDLAAARRVARAGTPVPDWATANVHSTERAMETAWAATLPYQAEFDRRGGWTRAFLVTSSTGGHVHSSMACATCRLTTEFCWLPEYSGADEEQIVADAGERACTVCYPTAAADVLGRATRIHSPAEKQAAAEREQAAQDRAQRAAAEQAKAITAPDGGPLRLPQYGLIRTERTARSEYVSEAAYVQAVAAGRAPGGRLEQARTAADLLAQALAAKAGVGVDELVASLAAKVSARVRRDYTP